MGKLKRVGVFGHPRSGTNYLSALVSENLLGGGNYRKHYPRPYSSHCARPHRVFERRDYRDLAVVYIMRETEPVLRSIWSMKQIWGVTSKTYDQFIETPWAQQFMKIRKDPIEVWDLEHRSRSSAVSSNFKGVNMRPPKFHRWHMAQWQRHADPRKFLVQYEELVEDPEPAIRKIGKMLGVKGFEFKPITDRVGFMPIEKDKA